MIQPLPSRRPLLAAALSGALGVLSLALPAGAEEEDSPAAMGPAPDEPRVWIDDSVRGDATLVVVVKAIQGRQGNIHFGLWNNAEDFTKAKRRIAGSRTPVAGETTRLTLEGIAPGTYAFAVFHDENGNGEFDTTLVGLPDEGLGFSNGAWITLLGAPSFKKAAIQVAAPETEAPVRLRY